MLRISPELYALLDRHLDTPEKLEVVLTLSDAKKPLTLPELALELQVGAEALRRVTDGVVASGIIEAVEDGGLRLRSGTWDPLIDEAARIYAANPQALMRTFTQIALGRIRGRAAATFADAFRIRKKGD